MHPRNSPRKSPIHGMAFGRESFPQNATEQNSLDFTLEKFKTGIRRHTNSTSRRILLQSETHSKRPRSFKMKNAKTFVATTGAWGSICLDLMAWVLLLSGTSAMQASCGGTNVQSVGGLAGYNAPISCDHFFGYTWWITFYNLGFVLAAIGTMATGNVSRFRPGLIGLGAIAAMQAMVCANTFLSLNQLNIDSETFKTRARVTLLVAVIKSIATLLFLIFAGMRDEKDTWVEETTQPTKKEKGPLGPPASQNPLQGDE
eukprot:jgi/Picre1/32957/NNA_008284.t1